MVEIISSDDQPLSNFDNHPIDDMRDGEDIQNWPDPLGQVISYIHTALFETYSEYDTLSMDEQKYYKIFSKIAVSFGSAAIILAILQLFLHSISLKIDTKLVQNVEFVSFLIQNFELVSFFIAVTAVIIAVAAKTQKVWLKKRFLAEQCRSLKFRALIHPFLWCTPERAWNDRFALWREQFNKKVSLLKKVDEKNIEEYITSDEVNQPPHDTTGCTIEIPSLKTLVGYYQKKRLSTQITYFQRKAQYFKSIDKWTGWIPNFCFIASVVCAAGHFGIDYIFPQEDPGLHLSSVLLLLTLVLPIFAIGARTLRSSIEVSRSSTLFQAKSRALEHFNTQLNEELAKSTIQWAEILKILWECENFIENENREWLRIMNDAEWFI